MSAQGSKPEGYGMGSGSDEDLGDLKTRLDIYMSWHTDDQLRINALEEHLRNVLEIARTWQPDYATKMDLDTLRYARECVGVKE